MEGLTSTGTHCGNVYEDQGVRLVCTLPRGHEGSHHARIEGDMRWRAMTAWRGEVCKRCWRRNCVGFNVDDATWAAVSQGRWNVLCATCFDEEAEAAGVRYHYGEVHPVSWNMWEEEP